MVKDRISGQTSPQVDLTTVRETLVYMRDDLGEAKGMQRIVEAIQITIDEIRLVEAQNLRSQLRVIRNARFLDGKR